MTTINGTPYRLIVPPAAPLATAGTEPVVAPDALTDQSTPTPAALAADTTARVTLRRRLIDAIRYDLATWWLTQARPASLTDRWRQRRNLRAKRTPGDNGLIRAAWAVDDWTFGLVVYGAGVALLMLAAGVWWTAAHPLRRWAALLLGTAAVLWVVMG